VVSSLSFRLVPVTPAARLLKRLCQRLFGTLDEGYAPPVRYRELAMMFANRHPKATRADWVEFAAGMADEAHKAGFVLGWEADVCTADKPWRADAPERAAAALDPGWRWAPEVLLDPEVPPRDG
jgi:hypothetical protein